MDHLASHADNGQHDRYDCCAFSRWRTIIPHVTWRPRRDWSKVDRTLDLPSDEQLQILANKLYPVPGKIRPQHHVLTALVAERHFCRWAKQPMEWTNRTAIRQPITIASGKVVGVAGRWIPFSGEIPPVITIPSSNTKPYDLVAAVLWHDFDYEPDFVGWQEMSVWKTSAKKSKTDLGMAGLSLSRAHFLQMKTLKPQTAEAQQPLFFHSE